MTRENEPAGFSSETYRDRHGYFWIRLSWTKDGKTITEKCGGTTKDPANFACTTMLDALQRAGYALKR